MARGRELGELDERERERERSGELKIRAFGGEGKRERTAPLCLRGGVRKYSGTAKLPPHLFPFFSPPIFFCFVGGSSYPIDYLHSSDDINILE
jgi:hypothetical protein